MKKNILLLLVFLLASCSKDPNGIIGLPINSPKSECINTVSPLLGFSVPPVNKFGASFLCHRGYSMLYNMEANQPFWVAENLNPSTVSLSPPYRSDGKMFRPDYLLPVLADLPYYKDGVVQSVFHYKRPIYEDYGYSKAGYSVGFYAHPLDFTIDRFKTSETFFLSNTAPMFPSTAKVWNAISANTQKLALAPSDLFVISGPIFASNYKPAFVGKNKNIRVPTHFFKIVLDVPRQQKIAFVVPNSNIPQDEVCKLEKYVKSVSQVENYTGILFWPVLDKTFAVNFKSAVGNGIYSDLASHQFCK